MKFIFTLALLVSFTSVSAQEIVSQDYEWKGIFVAGDHSIPNFDRARVDLAAVFASYGLSEQNQVHYSRDKDLIDGSSVMAPTAENLAKGFQSLNIKSDTDACFIHMTSHGVKGRGFYLSEIGLLSAGGLASFVNAFCKTNPAVILVSACYSGQFITKGLKADNRIILTAARHDLPSFGCSTATTYTYWDGCLLEEMDKSDTWKELYDNVKVCIENKENEQGTNRSYPQGFFGKKVENLRIFNK